MKVGILGAGNIARAHAACMKQACPDVELAGASDIVPSRAKVFGHEFGIRSFESNAALLDTDVDAVFVCSNPAAHKACVLESLSAGKHVFCEKPLALTLDEGLEIARAVEASGRLFMLGYLFHHSRVANRIKSLVDSGGLGAVSAAWSQRFGYFAPPPGSWYADPAEGGILDLCTHDIEFLCWWCGRPRSVSATAVTVHPSITCVDTVNIAMEFAQGMGTVLSSWASPRSVTNIGVSGTKGTAVFTIEGESASVAVTFNGKAEAVEEQENPADAMAAEQRAFFDAIRTGHAPSPGIAEGLVAIEVHEAAQRSWTTGARTFLSIQGE
jgi:predicted dehydrogenase